LENAKVAILKKQQAKANQPLFEIQCTYCKKTAMSITGAKKYCSHTCRSKYFNLKSRILTKEYQIVKYQKEIEEMRARL
jgi:hypothetical protein